MNNDVSRRDGELLGGLAGRAGRPLRVEGVLAQHDLGDGVFRVVESGVGQDVTSKKNNLKRNTMKLGLNELGYNELRYNELSYNESIFQS